MHIIHRCIKRCAKIDEGHGGDEEHGITITLLCVLILPYFDLKDAESQTPFSEIESLIGAQILLAKT